MLRLRCAVVAKLAEEGHGEHHYSKYAAMFWTMHLHSLRRSAHKHVPSLTNFAFHRYQGLVVAWF